MQRLQQPLQEEKENLQPQQEQHLQRWQEVAGEAELKSRLRRVLTIEDYLREADPNEQSQRLQQRQERCRKLRQQRERDLGQQ